jgi:hypothetical protein
LVSGHTGDVVHRKDVEQTKSYAFDVYETVKRLGSGPLNDRIDQELVDIWTESHCRAMLLYVRWSD